MASRVRARYRQNSCSSLFASLCPFSCLAEEAKLKPHHKKPRGQTHSKEEARKAHKKPRKELSEVAGSYRRRPLGFPHLPQTSPGTRPDFRRRPTAQLGIQSIGTKRQQRRSKSCPSGSGPTHLSLPALVTRNHQAEVTTQSRKKFRAISRQASMN